MKAVSARILPFVKLNNFTVMRICAMGIPWGFASEKSRSVAKNLTDRTDDASVSLKILKRGLIELFVGLYK
jgi:hypothetical protein